MDHVGTLDSHKKLDHSKPGHQKFPAGINWYTYSKSSTNQWKMATVYVLINYEIRIEHTILNKLKNVWGVVEVSEVVFMIKL
jgi:hypothetical protein